MDNDNTKRHQQLEARADEAKFPGGSLARHEDPVDPVDLHQQGSVHQRQADMKRHVGHETRRRRRLDQEDGYSQASQQVTQQHDGAELSARGLDQSARAAPDVERGTREHERQHEEVKGHEGEAERRGEGHVADRDGVARLARVRVGPGEVSL